MYVLYVLLFCFSPISPAHVDWHKYYPVHFNSADQLSKCPERGQEKQVEMADIGCGYGGLLGKFYKLLFEIWSYYHFFFVCVCIILQINSLSLDLPYHMARHEIRAFRVSTTTRFASRHPSIILRDSIGQPVKKQSRFSLPTYVN